MCSIGWYGQILMIGSLTRQLAYWYATLYCAWKSIPRNQLQLMSAADVKPIDQQAVGHKFLKRARRWCTHLVQVFAPATKCWGVRRLPDLNTAIYLNGDQTSLWLRGSRSLVWLYPGSVRRLFWRQGIWIHSLWSFFFFFLSFLFLPLSLNPTPPYTRAHHNNFQTLARMNQWEILCARWKCLLKPFQRLPSPAINSSPCHFPSAWPKFAKRSVDWLPPFFTAQAKYFCCLFAQLASIQV